jgi:hypothetical protein
MKDVKRWTRKMTESETGYIYTLSDPRNDEVRYVGATKQPEQRLKSHIDHPHTDELQEWVSDLSEESQSPEMHIINVSTVSELSEKEQAALDDLSDEFALLNKQRQSGYGRGSSEMITSDTPNKRHEPTGTELSVLKTFKNERRTRQASRMTPSLIQKRFRTEVSEGDRSTISKSGVNTGLKYLMAAGWVEKVDDGLYEYITDPRQIEPTAD